MDTKIALVTGASRGIGQAIASKIAKKGIFVIGTATTKAGADSINENFKKAGLAGEGKVLDVKDQEQAKALVTDISDRLGTINILVNNAGITKDNLMLRMKFEEEWQSVIDINLSAVFYLTQLCLSNMLKARWGRIVNISSVVGFIGNPGQVNYCAAKAGLIGFTKSLAKEIAQRGVTVNAVAPGFIDTQMTQKLTEQQREAILQSIPMKRPGFPEDIASAVIFLISDGANYITGQTIHVNGGMY
jgi:3-oxoacyl-[acyl-carrier protein] reductase